MIRLDHAHIFASDIDATIAFWQTMFGARVVFDEALVGQRNVRLDIGGGALHLYDQPPRGLDRGLVHHLGIRTDDLPGLVAHMQAHGAIFRKPISEQPSFRYVMFEAPDGLLLKLYEVKPGGREMFGLAG